MTQLVSMSYTLNVGKLYFIPSVSYRYISDMIENKGYSDGGVYYSTYANTGHCAQTSAGADLSYRFKGGEESMLVADGKLTITWDKTPRTLPMPHLALMHE